ETGLRPPGKYDPAGEAITENVTCAAGRTPRNTSEANMNGRMYRLVSPPEGTQAASVDTSASIAPTKSSSGTSGSARRYDERSIRAALAYGRKVRTVPS